MSPVPHVVILLENLPVARDRRVWREAEALRDAGIGVTVICPAPDGRRHVEVIDGIEVRSYRSAPEASSVVGFVLEYGVAFVGISMELLRVLRSRPVHAVQACNPPDMFFPLALALRTRGIPFVFDQHDLVPELYETRFGRRDVFVRLLLWCERLTYRWATRVISTNESYRAVAMARGGKRRDHVTVVRNGPDPDLMRRRPARPERRVADGEGPVAAGLGVEGESPRDERSVIVWMGNMGPQDGVDEAVDCARIVVEEHGRTDCRFVFIGTGEVLDQLRARTIEMGLDKWVEFTGWIPDDEAFAILSTATIGLSADPPGPLNDKSTMNKTLEYMSFELPVVAHDLVETRASAGGAATYAASGDAAGLASSIVELLDDPARQRRMARIGRRRIEEGLSWPHQRRAYVALYRELLRLPGDDEEAGSGEAILAQGEVS